MMRSLYSGVSGLKTHQTKMDVIGNNIANVNTMAYKSASVTFAELMYQTSSQASGPNATTGAGGINPKQIGLGVQSGAISTAITQQGSAQSTGNPFDLMITGDSFFVVSNGTENYFTRAGAFYLDGGGNLAMTSNGYNVMGWQVDPETQEIKKDTVSPLRIMSSENLTYPPEATSFGTVSGIIDKNTANVNSKDGQVINFNFYDNLGYSYTAKFALKSTAEEGVFTIELSDVLDINNESVMEKYGASFATGLVGQNVDVKTALGLNKDSQYEIQDDGSILDMTTPPGTAAAPTQDIIASLFGYDSTAAAGTPEKKAYDEFIAGTIKFPEIDDTEYPDLAAIFAGATPPGSLTPAALATAAAADPNVMKDLKKYFDAKDTGLIAETSTNIQNATTLTFNTNKGDITNVGANGLDNLTSMLTFGAAGNPFSDITLDFSATTNKNNGKSTTMGIEAGDDKKKGLGAGRKLGELSEVSISQEGMIYASYDNGEKKLLGQIAVASFANPSGLEKIGDNLYNTTMNSGDFDGVGQDITTDGTGKMSQGALEMSNVDLSSEFTEMITTQRGFQANSRIITVSDTLLEELTNLKR